MDRDSVERLRHDRRLVRRREWVSDEDRTAFLESLPDVSDKMTRGIDEPEEEAAQSPASQQPSTPGYSFSSPGAAGAQDTSGTPSGADGGSSSFGPTSGGSSNPSDGNRFS